MALKKLPCEYPENGIRHAKELFEGWTTKQKQHFVDAIEKCANNMDKIKKDDLRERYLKNQNI